MPNNVHITNTPMASLLRPRSDVKFDEHESLLSELLDVYEEKIYLYI